MHSLWERKIWLLLCSNFCKIKYKIQKLINNLLKHNHSFNHRSKLYCYVWHLIPSMLCQTEWECWPINLTQENLCLPFFQVSGRYTLPYLCFVELDAPPFFIPWSFDNQGEEVVSVSSSWIQFLFDILTLLRKTGDSGLLGRHSEMETNSC